jgi:tRNA threonylcarbamoyladenosine biosynthesis protein TsaE
MFDQCTFQASGSIETRKIALSLAQSLYKKSCTIFITGVLGAGKTTFIQGLAEGIGVKEHITSPSYALENRSVDGKFAHIDLYRLQPKEALQFVEELDECEGIRVIEWPERASLQNPDINVVIQEKSREDRMITIHCKDIAIPSQKDIEAFIVDTGLPSHIVDHMQSVANVCNIIADELMKQKRFVRKNALHAAALCHDLLRFIDFAEQEQQPRWEMFKKTYGVTHEEAAKNYLNEKGFPEIGSIVSTHRGSERPGDPVPKSIEQLALAYGDKRSMHDNVVTVDERFDDFVVRYGQGKESTVSKAWRKSIQSIEQKLFPSGVPF